MKRQYSLTLAVLFMIFYNVASGVQFLNCGSKTGKLTSMEVSGCNTTSDACVLKSGTNVPITIGFTVFEEVTDVKAYVYGKYINYYGIVSPLLWPTDCCVTNALRCPLQEGTNHQYKAYLTVSEHYAKTPLIVRYQLLDANKQQIIVCAEFPANIV